MKKIDYQWIKTATLLGFIITLLFTLISEITLAKLNFNFASIVILFFILLGVVFDMIGNAVMAADIKPFNSMAANKASGGKVAVAVIQNASKVASFLNDIIGDICGIISGSLGIILAVAISDYYQINPLPIILLITSIIAALTIGGKAIGKEIALNKNVMIITIFAKTITIFLKTKF